MNNKKKNEQALDQKLRSLRRFYLNHAAAKYIIIMSVFLIIIIGLLGTGISATHVSNVADTGLRDWQQIADGYQVGMTNRGYNPDKKIMRIGLSLQNNDVTDSVYPRLKFKVKLLNQENDVHTEVIRAGDSSYVVIVKNLKPKFGAVLVKISSLNKDNLNNITTVADTDLTSNETITDADTKNSQDNGTVNIYINETNNIIDHNLKDKSKIGYQVETVKTEISFLKKSIRQLNKKIDSAKGKIEDDQAAIEKVKKESKYEISEEKKANKQKNDQTKRDITNKKQEIKKLQHAIKIRKQKIDLLNQKITDINNGTYKN